MIIENPTSGVQKTVLGPFHRLWAFLFGFIYYAAKGMWGPAIISFLTFNGLFVVFPLWNRTIVKDYYETNGWRAYDDVFAFSTQNKPPRRPEDN